MHVVYPLHKTRFFIGRAARVPRREPRCLGPVPAGHQRRDSVPGPLAQPLPCAGNSSRAGGDAPAPQRGQALLSRRDMPCHRIQNLVSPHSATEHSRQWVVMQSRPDDTLRVVLKISSARRFFRFMYRLTVCWQACNSSAHQNVKCREEGRRRGCSWEFKRHFLAPRKATPTGSTSRHCRRRTVLGSRAQTQRATPIARARGCRRREGSPFSCCPFKLHSLQKRTIAARSSSPDDAHHQNSRVKVIVENSR